MPIDHTRLSKSISHALRHDPARYGLTLDAEGWVPVAALLDALIQRNPAWAALDEATLHAMMAAASKQRFELHAGRIRARYGHSIAQRIHKEPSVPPPLLFHGTAPTSVAHIRREGLRPMRRHYVHLAAEEASARLVGQRKAPRPAILRVRAAEAHASGIAFYDEGGGIWLAEALPVAFIEFDAASTS